MILDIFGHYVVGWMLARQESAALARRIIEETCHKQAIQLNQLTIHADREFSMTSKPVAFLLADQGVTKTNSRPHKGGQILFHPIENLEELLLAIAGKTVQRGYQTAHFLQRSSVSTLNGRQRRKSSSPGRAAPVRREYAKPGGCDSKKAS